MLGASAAVSQVDRRRKEKIKYGSGLGGTNCEFGREEREESVDRK